MKRLFTVVLVLCLAFMAFSQDKPKQAQEAKVAPPAKQETPPAKPAEGESRVPPAVGMASWSGTCAPGN